MFIHIPINLRTLQFSQFCLYSLQVSLVYIPKVIGWGGGGKGAAFYIKHEHLITVITAYLVLLKVVPNAYPYRARL